MAESGRQQRCGRPEASDRGGGSPGHLPHDPRGSPRPPRWKTWLRCFVRAMWSRTPFTATITVVLGSGGKVIESPERRAAARHRLRYRSRHGQLLVQSGGAGAGPGLHPGQSAPTFTPTAWRGRCTISSTVLSKFLHLGLSLEEVIRLSTEAPARVMGLAGRVGTLKAGAEGDAALLRLDEGRFPLTDTMGVTVEANRKLSRVGTVRRGRIYRPYLRATRSSSARSTTEGSHSPRRVLLQLIDARQSSASWRCSSLTRPFRSASSRSWQTSPEVTGNGWTFTDMAPGGLQCPGSLAP